MIYICEAFLNPEDNVHVHTENRKTSVVWSAQSAAYVVLFYKERQQV